MNDTQNKIRNAGFITFFLSGICAMASGIVVSMLQEKYGFAYSMTGTLLSLMSIGNLLASFLAGVLPGKLGMKKSVLLLTCFYPLGYFLMGSTGVLLLLALSFFLIGVSKGAAINTCTILVSDNSENRTRGMNIMHSCYACGALLCPFLITAAATKAANVNGALFNLGIFGLLLWVIFLRTPMEQSKAAAASPKGQAGSSSSQATASQAATSQAAISQAAASQAADNATDWSFLRSTRFWLLTSLLFFQMAGETGVSGWMVTYFKGSGIITSRLSPYTVSVMWGATLIGRLLLAFVIPVKNAYSAMIKMCIGCIIFYCGLMLTHTQLPALLLLFCFAFSMAGLNPTAVACAGKMTSVTSMGVMIPLYSLSGILMPWLIGQIAERAGLQFGMASIIVPCICTLVIACLLKREDRKQETDR